MIALLTMRGPEKVLSSQLEIRPKEGYFVLLSSPKLTLFKTIFVCANVQVPNSSLSFV